MRGAIDGVNSYATKRIYAVYSIMTMKPLFSLATKAIFYLVSLVPVLASAATYNYSAETDICGAGGLTITVNVGDTVNISDTQNTCVTGNITGMANRGTFSFIANGGSDYIFRVVTTAAGIGTGTSTWSGGAVFSITVAAAPPIATTQPATAISPEGATLNGLVDPNFTATTVAFEYGQSTGYGTTVAASAVSAGSGSTSRSVAINGLTCNTTYHYRVNAQNLGGTTNGADQSFTTTACPAPTVVTDVATAVGKTSATLNAFVSSNGTASTVAFEYGPTIAYGTTVAATSGAYAPGNAVNAPASVTLALACGTIIHYRAVATNSGGTAVGADQIATTDACTPTSVPTLSQWTLLLVSMLMASLGALTIRRKD